MTQQSAQQFLANPVLSSETMAAVAVYVESLVEVEYRRGNMAAQKGARLLALAGVIMDVARPFVEATGGSRGGLDAYADHTLNIVVRGLMEARRCECTGHAGNRSHRYACTNHTEADVPLVGGKRLCGTCYVTGDGK
jgi:hypothetical protein